MSNEAVCPCGTNAQQCHDPHWEACLNVCAESWCRVAGSEKDCVGYGERHVTAVETLKPELLKPLALEALCIVVA